MTWVEVLFCIQTYTSTNYHVMIGNVKLGDIKDLQKYMDLKVPDRETLPFPCASKIKEYIRMYNDQIMQTRLFVL